MKKLIIYLFFCILLVGCKSRPNNCFTIRNDSNSIVKKVEVEVCRQKFTTEKLVPSENVSFKYNDKGDSDYNVRVEYDNSKKIQKRLGYVTNGLVFNDLIVIEINDVNLVQDFY